MDTETTVPCYCVEAADLHDDTRWADTFGHDCAWYLHMSTLQPRVCDIPGAREHCKLGCLTTPCFTGKEHKPPSRYLYNHVERLEPRHRNGSVCLSSSLDVEEVLRKCEAGEQHPSYQLLQDKLLRDGARHVNLTDCEQLGLAIDEACRFDGKTVEDWSDGACPSALRATATSKADPEEARLDLEMSEGRRTYILSLSQGRASESRIPEKISRMSACAAP
jgi:hypothetical protein